MDIFIFYLVQEDGAINKVLFLDKRSRYVKTAATLVSSGPDGEFLIQFFLQ